MSPPAAPHHMVAMPPKFPKMFPSCLIYQNSELTKEVVRTDPYRWQLHYQICYSSWHFDLLSPQQQSFWYAWTLSSWNPLSTHSHFSTHKVFKVNLKLAAIEDFLTYCITVWYVCSFASDRKALQRLVNTSEIATGWPLPPLEDFTTSRYLSCAKNIIKDYNSPLIPLLLNAGLWQTFLP